MKSFLLLALCALLKYAEAGCYNGTDPSLCSDSSCRGSCTFANGCYCAGDILECVPTATQCPMDDDSCCNNLVGWFWDTSLQCCTDVPLCNLACLTDEVCQIINNEATCVCNTTTYSGIKTSDLQPSLKCDGGTMIPSISQCQLKQLGYNISSLHIRNDSIACTYVFDDIINNIRVQSFQVKAAIGWCGNTVNQNDSSKIYFTNTLQIDPNSGPLITKNPIVFNFTCGYNLTMQTSLNFSLNPIVSSVVLPSQGESGSYTITLAAFSEATFTVPIQVNEEIKVGSSVYLGLFSPDMDGNLFALRVEKCFATPTINPDDPTNVVFVSAGCAVDGDILTTVIQNGNSSEARIQTSAFLFQGYTEVYIFCNVRLCNKTSGCEGCGLSRSLLADSSQLGIQLTLQDFDYNTSSGHYTVASWTMLAASLLGLLSVKLF
ncbi:pancreatic secretory granule membrane major glycoprotein GP2-like [Engystomops pustulosus]|uniref:pancreatic secretory granule membrane major glycoprotein GP2-like n=1 Tax=Engystomops pustulosus TaxID=76066 RepID=UPI003AFAF952